MGHIYLLSLVLWILGQPAHSSCPIAPYRLSDLPDGYDIAEGMPVFKK